MLSSADEACMTQVQHTDIREEHAYFTIQA